MTAVPAQAHFVFTVQDAHGDIATVRFPTFNPDISADADAISVWYANTAAMGTALAACMNGKIVESGFTFHFSRAQKPAGPLSTYAHVYQGVRLNFGDGQLERMAVTVPTPKTSDLLTDGITANPADANVAALITAIEAHCVAGSNSPFNEYLGGRFREGKPRRRTNLYNSAA